MKWQFIVTHTVCQTEIPTLPDSGVTNTPSVKMLCPQTSCLCVCFHMNTLTQLTYLLTYSVEQSPSWDANQLSDSQEIPCILWNLKFHYRIHKCPPPIPILSQLDPVHTPTSHFLKIHLNVILPCKRGSPMWSLSFRFPHHNPVYAFPLPHTRYMPCPSHSSRFYHPNNTGWGVQIIKLLIM